MDLKKQLKCYVLRYPVTPNWNLDKHYVLQDTEFLEASE